MCARTAQTEVASADALTVTEAARYLNIKAATLYAWIYREKIAAFKLRGRWRLNRACLKSLTGAKR
jgi:excisionase family DNA binding protein